MREDMFKVIVERPRMRLPKRNGSHYPRGSLKQAWREPEDAPKREAMGRGYGYKCLNENLGPLRRFLRSRVGRPWDAVYSEICEHVSLDSAVKKHVLEHLDDLVVRRTQERDGRLYALDRWGGPLELGPARGRRQLYVCPRTGLLRVLERQTLAPKFPGQALDAMRELRRIDGTWYLVRFAPVPPSWEERQQAYDVVLKQHVHLLVGRHGPLKNTWGRQDRYARGMQRLTPKEYQRLLRAPASLPRP